MTTVVTVTYPDHDVHCWRVSSDATLFTTSPDVPRDCVRLCDIHGTEVFLRWSALLGISIKDVTAEEEETLISLGLLKPWNPER